MTLTREEVQSELDRLDRRVNSIQGEAALLSVKSEVDEMDQMVTQLLTTIQTLRGRGYAFEPELETQARQFMRDWPPKRNQAMTDIRRSARELEIQFAPLQQSMRQLSAYASRPVQAEVQIQRMTDKISDFESGLNTKRRAVTSAFAGFSTEAHEFNNRLSEIEDMLDVVADASFELLKTEGCLMAVEARWYHDGSEDKRDPKGILYLTDQRMIFEHIEKIVKKKVLFITTESETVRKLMFETPIAYIDAVKATQEGFLNGESHIEIRFTAQGPYDFTQFRLFDGDNEEFGRVIKRIQAGEFKTNRAIDIDQAVLEQVRNAPSNCPSCGAPLQQEILRGQEDIRCEFCGYVIRL